MIADQIAHKRKTQSIVILPDHGAYKNRRDLTGTRHGRLVLQRRLGVDRYRNPIWECLCDCGTLLAVRLCNLRKGCTISCGCANKETQSQRLLIHGLTKTCEKEMGAYASAKRRCNSDAPEFVRCYKDRGIEFRFQSFEEFFAELGPKPGPRYSVDRIDNDGHYEPGNVRWATPKQQAANRRPRPRDWRGRFNSERLDPRKETR